jgi:type IV pilus assembly protein PilA
MSINQATPQKKGLSTGCIVAVAVTAVMLLVVVPAVAALSISGVRRYLAAAKTAEAKNTVSAIARAASTSYERTHTLCESAGPVPASVPRGVNYQPSKASGSDFNAGTEERGWRCLRFSAVQPIYYQYHYNARAGYRTRDGHVLNADGFEAMAAGDLNGNGVESHFARRGQVGPSGVKLDTEIFVENEFE